jgi:hypothetical protein
MAANLNQTLSGGKGETIIKNLSVAKTSNAEIGAPADATDLRELFTAGSNGGFIDEFFYQVIGTGTQAAFLIHIWKTDAAGANARLWKNIQVATGSAQSTTTPGQSSSLYLNFENLQAGVKIFASVTVVSSNCTINVGVNGGQFESQ